MPGRHRRQPPASGNRGRHRKPPRRAHLVLPAAAAVGVLGVGGVSAAAVLASSGGGSHSAPTPAPVPRGVPSVTLSPSAPLSTPIAPSPSAPAAVRRPAGAAPNVLALTAVGRVSWVQVVGPHGRVLFIGMLRHGKTISFTARPLEITLGNAGAVRVVHGPAVYAHAGHNGQVKRFHVTS